VPRSLSQIIERRELVEHARSVGFPVELCQQIYEMGYSDAADAARRNRLRREESTALALQTAQVSLRAKLEEAEARGFQRGLASSRARTRPYERPRERTRTHARPSPPPPASPRGRAQILSEVEAQCRIISESNPSMTPAINALRHRLKKLEG